VQRALTGHRNILPEIISIQIEHHVDESMKTGGPLRLSVEADKLNFVGLSCAKKSLNSLQKLTNFSSADNHRSS
jgi:hypothetical protein